MKAVVCKTCGKEFLVYPSVKRQFCSRVCSKGTGARTYTRGASKTRLHSIWMDMRKRCTSTTHKRAENYVGRGIVVCERWLVFERFAEDMGEPPSDAHSIDRIDNDGNYEPGNCRWATLREQANNTSKSVFVEAYGERKTVAYWSNDERCVVKYDTLLARIRRGWDGERALATPAGKPFGARQKAGVEILEESNL